MSFLVTGGSGFIGSALVHYLLEKYKNKLIINASKQTYAVSPKTIRFLDKYTKYKFYPLDIRDALYLHKLMVKHKVERVYHLAAETHVDRSFVYPEDFLDSNVKGTFSILEGIRLMKKPPVLYYMGTDEVFGDVKTGFKREDEKLHPENPYVASKVAAEAYCTTWNACYKLPIIIGRSMNVYGDRQHPEKLIGKIIAHCVTDKPYQLYKGNSLRGWTYVYDTADAIDTIITKGKVGEIYHIPPVVYKGVEDVNSDILDIVGKHGLFKGYTGKRLKDDYRYALGTTKMQYELNWKPRCSWKEGLKKAIEWYSNNKELWK